jgi:ribonuclease P protein component
VLGRIRERAVFERFREEGRRVRHGSVWVSFIPEPEGPPRVAFALGRTLGTAPMRNRARRRLRAALAARQSELPGGWYLVGASPDIVRSSFQEIDIAVERVVSRLREQA